MKHLNVYNIMGRSYFWVPVEEVIGMNVLDVEETEFFLEINGVMIIMWVLCRIGPILEMGTQKESSGTNSG